MRALFIDSTLCINCKACQVACKKWHALPAEEQDTYPQELSGTRLTLVKDHCAEIGGRARLLFFKEQCRHCSRPRCAAACPVDAIEVEPDTRAVVITPACNPDECTLSDGTRPCENACVYGVPKFDAGRNRDRKCDLCYDRITDGSGRGTSCADACPTGAIAFGEMGEIRSIAADRLRQIQSEFPDAMIYSGAYGRTSVIWLLTAEPSAYGF